MTATEKELLNYIERLIISNELSLEFLVKNIELNMGYSNGMTAANYHKRKGISYNGAKTPTKKRIVHKLDGIPFCFEND